MSKVIRNLFILCSFVAYKMLIRMLNLERSGETTFKTLSWEEVDHCFLFYFKVAMI